MTKLAVVKRGWRIRYSNVKLYYLNLLFIENISRDLIGLELSMKLSYL